MHCVSIPLVNTAPESGYSQPAHNFTTTNCTAHHHELATAIAAKEPIKYSTAHHHELVTRTTDTASRTNTLVVNRPVNLLAISHDTGAVGDTGAAFVDTGAVGDTLGFATSAAAASAAAGAVGDTVAAFVDTGAVGDTGTASVA